MNYNDNYSSLKSFYAEIGISEHFEKDNDYLKGAFEGIQHLWLQNFEKVDSVKCIMIGEAPLWGNDKSYIYNPETVNSQFFYREDLACLVTENCQLEDKTQFLERLNELGIVIVDISPFALNPENTEINYRILGRGAYKSLIQLSSPNYFEKKLDWVAKKSVPNVKVVFRYKRVKDLFQKIVGPMLVARKISTVDEIHHVSQRGGGIDRRKLKSLFGN